ncbi:nucleoside-diphosphate kinase, partial [Coemansia spiralis]
MERAEDAHSTLAIIKPDISGNDAAVLQIIKRIVSRGYNIKDRIDITLSQNQAKAFYAEHAAKPFFDDLVAFMTSGPIIALLLEGDDVIRGWRMMIGSIDPDTARKDVPQSIRALLGASSPRNAVHGSDSVQSAQRELFFFFSPR